MLCLMNTAYIFFSSLSVQAERLVTTTPLDRDSPRDPEKGPSILSFGTITGINLIVLRWMSRMFGPRGSGESKKRKQKFGRTKARRALPPCAAKFPLYLPLERLPPPLPGGNFGSGDRSILGKWQQELLLFTRNVNWALYLQFACFAFIMCLLTLFCNSI